MISTRVKFFLLVILNATIILLPASSYLFHGLILVTCNFLFYKALITNFKSIFVYLLGFLIVAALINHFTSGADLINTLPDFLKLFSIINVSILLATDLNVMELVACISKIGIPAKIAIAFGVGFRYFPLLIHDMKRVHFIQTAKGYGLTFKSFRSNGVLESLSKYLVPLFLSVLKRTDNIALSVTIQQLEKRIKYYKSKKLNVMEIVILVVAFFTFIIIISEHFFSHTLY